MRRTSRRQFLRTAALPLAWPAGRAFAATPETWVPLFNGRDLAGWVPVNVAPGTFTVRDGLIVSTGKPTGVLRSDRHYENFILELEWRHLVKGGNAGLFVYAEPITAPGVPFAKAIEVQILDGDSPEGVWTGHGDVFSIHGARMQPDRPHPQGWERCLPSERRAHPAGEWNHYRVESRDGRLTLAVNGKVVSGGSQCRPRRGYLCLESEGSECHFRNLRIQELPSSHPPAAETASLAAGHQSLYTGLDLSGWQASPAHRPHWKSEDWTLTSDGQGPAEIHTETEFGDGEFIVDWRLPGGQGSAGLRWRGSRDEEQALAAPDDAWHRARITLRGQHVAVAIDDREVRREAQAGGGPARGPLALRHHQRPVQFANLYFRPFA